MFIAENLDDAIQAGFDDAFQYEDFSKPIQERRLEIITDFEQELGMQALKHGRRNQIGIRTKCNERLSGMPCYLPGNVTSVSSNPTRHIRQAF